MAHYIDEDYFTGPQTRLKEIVVTANKPKKSYSGYTEPLPRSVQPVNISDITKGVHAVVNPALAWFSPSQYYGAFRDTDNAADWFRSMMRGNSGFVTKEFEEKHPWLSLATNMVGDAATLGGIAKGFKYALEAIPRVSLGRNAAGDWNGWVNVGNYQYRPNRSSLGMGKLVEREPITQADNSLFLERRHSIKPEDLANRKFFSVEEYGPEPIYTRETIPKKIEVKMAEDDVNPTLYDDITYMNENFDEKTMSTMQVARNRLKLWKESPHGRAINFGGDTDLSTSSWPQTLKFNMNRHLDGTGTAYIPDNYGTIESFLNNAGELPINQKTVDYFNTLIEEFNRKTGLNLSKARFVPESTKQLPAGRVLRTPARLYVPNLGLIKHKHGAKIMLKS